MSNIAYVVDQGEKDLSRWLTLSQISDSEFIVRLGDMTHPGMQSAMKEFRCSLSVLRDLLSQGRVQIRVPGGYCNMRAHGQLIQVAFGADLDESGTHCTILAEDFAKLLEAGRVPVGAA